jgi:hypothetical protein
MGGISAIYRYLVQCTRLAFDDASAANDRNLAALLKHVADPLSATLHTRLEA